MRIAGKAIAALTVLLGATLLAPQTAGAGDTASLNVIGYSEDGRIFAFEEYGVQDGSGFAYSNYFFLDTQTDEFLPGTPIRLLAEDELSLGKTRKLAADKAAALVAQHKLTDNPGSLLAYNPPSEMNSNAFSLRFYSHVSSALMTEWTNTLELTEQEFPPSKDCLNMTGSYKGFTLTLMEDGGKPVDRVIHADMSVPASRFCANGYRIGAVIGSETNRAPVVAMILVSRFGFEGPDRRWIAVPVPATGP
jgi:predicted secreted protein